MNRNWLENTLRETDDGGNKPERDKYKGDVRRRWQTEKRQREVSGDEGERIRLRWRKKKRKERSGFLFPNSGFLDNDWGIMVLSLSSPNETRGPARPKMFISLNFSSFPFFHLWHKNHICAICIQFAWQPTLPSPHPLPPVFFLHIQQSSLAKAGICGLLTSGGDIFWEIPSAKTFFTAASYADLSRRLLNHCFTRLGPCCLCLAATKR